MAISPELPDESLSLIEKHNLEYEILTDLENKVAKGFGIVFSIEGELRKTFDGFGLDLAAVHGNPNYELPVPATYVIDKNGIIILAHADVDHTTRMEPEDVLEVL